jgi:DNA polymerase III delta prime subunit
MHAYLISGSGTKTIEEKIQSLLTEWSVSVFDTLTLEKEEERKEISISQIRGMTQQLQLSPTNGPFTVAVIKNAHLMTIPAQNAILKILEEPPAKAKIILTTSMTDALLPTIISRCEKCSVRTVENIHDTTSLTLEYLFRFETQSLSHTLAQISEYTNTREEALEFVDSALQVLHTAFVTDKTSPFGPEKCAKFAEVLLKTRMQLQANVNPKLALDSAFL